MSRSVVFTTVNMSAALTFILEYSGCLYSSGRQLFARGFVCRIHPFYTLNDTVLLIQRDSAPLKFPKGKTDVTYQLWAPCDPHFSLSRCAMR